MKITALLPVKDGSIFLEKSRMAITSNCHEEDEILVVDDGSVDNSLSKLLLWANEDLRVRVISNPNPGLVNALNLGIIESSNRYIARFDVDDDYENYRISKQRERLEEGIVAVFSDYDFKTPSGRHLGNIPSAVSASAVSISLVNSQRTAHPSVLFDKEAVIAVGGYREEDFPAEDLSLWLRLSRVGNLVSIPETLLHYRLSPNSITGQKRNEALSQRDKLITTIKINPPDIQSVAESWMEIFQEYDLYEAPVSRKLLLYKDFAKCVRNISLDGVSFNQIKNIRNELITSPSTYLAALRLASEMRSRKKFRKTAS